MNESTSADLIDFFKALADDIKTQANRLSELDGAIGDADHGVTMEIGFTAVQKDFAELDPTTVSPTDVFNRVAKTFLQAVGASAGPLYATAFMRAGASVKGKQTLDTTSWATTIQAMAEGIQTRGKAQAGQKTMLDAWLPAAQAAQQALAANSDTATLLQQVATAAAAGAQATKEMQATMGRAARLGPRSIGHIDPGAASTAVILDSLACFIKSK